MPSLDVRYLVTPKGDASEDSSNFLTQYLSLCKSSSGGELWIQDNNGKDLILDSNVLATLYTQTSAYPSVQTYLKRVPDNKEVYFQSLVPFTLRGENRNVRIVLTSSSPSTYYPPRFIWNMANNPYNVWSSSNSSAIKDAAVAAPYVELVTPSATPAYKVGDWIVVMSDDVIPNLACHSDSSSVKEGSSPHELHRISYVEMSGLNVVKLHLSSPLIDLVTQANGARVYVVSMIANSGIVNLRVGSTDSVRTVGVQNPARYINTFEARGVKNFRVEDLRYEENGVGALWLDLAANTHIYNFSGYQTMNDYYDYGLVVGTVNDLIFSDSVWHGSHHVFTTTGYTPSASRTPLKGGAAPRQSRLGTAAGVLVKNVTAHTQALESAPGTLVARVAFDTHNEGYGIVFDGCRVYSSSPDGIQNKGWWIRSRKTTIVNCEYHGDKKYLVGTPYQENYANPNTSYGIRSTGWETSVLNTRIYNTWIGILLFRSDYVMPGWTSSGDMVYGHFGGHVISDCLFDNCYSVGVLQRSSGDRLNIRNCNFTGATGFVANNDPFCPPTLIQINDGTGHKVMNNNLSKVIGTNEYAGGTVYNLYSIIVGGKQGVSQDGLPSDQVVAPGDITIAGNAMTGYGAQRLGVTYGNTDEIRNTNATAYNTLVNLTNNFHD